MKNLSHLILFGFIVLLYSCKEETVIPDTTPPLFIAPCELTEFEYDLDSVFYDMTTYPFAAFAVRLYDTAGANEGYTQLSFNKYPETGAYCFVQNFDNSNTTCPNQMNHMSVFQYDIFTSMDASYPQIFVESNDSVLIVSYCKLNYNSYYYSTSNHWYEGFPYNYMSYRIRL